VGEQVQRGAGRRVRASRKPERQPLRFAATMASAAPRSTSGRRSTAAWTSRTRRRKALEDENRRLKKLLAEAMLDNAMLKDVASRKW